MLETISGTSVNQPVTKLMLRADQESVSRDLRQSRLDVNEFSYGVPVERYVFDAIRRKNPVAAEEASRRMVTRTASRAAAAIGATEASL